MVISFEFFWQIFNTILLISIPFVIYILVKNYITRYRNNNTSINNKLSILEDRITNLENK